MITKVKSHKEFLEVAKTYKCSLKKINSKINNAEDISQLATLKSMARDLKESIKELENYYKKNYWRNEKLTMNSRKAVKIYFNNIDEIN